jgi:hypothetical protein
MPEMTVCPVCEHAQVTGDECEVCGRRLSGSAAPAVVSPLEGLERTALEEAGAVEAAPLADMEPTAQSAEAVEGERMPDLERTGLEAVAAEAEGEAVPGLEPTSSDPLAWEERTPMVLAPHCRYCRTPAVPGEVICGRCGMQLPLFRPAMAQSPEGVSWRCPSCGASVPADVCPGCGGRMPGSSGSPLVDRA